MAIYGVFVGIDQYRDDRIGNLKCSVADARAMCDLFENVGAQVQLIFWGMHLTPEAPRSSIRALEDYSRTLGSFKSASPSGFKVNRCRPPAGRNERRL